MLHYEDVVGRKLYCIRTDKFKKEYSFVKKGKTDIKTIEKSDAEDYRVTVISDIYAFKFNSEVPKNQKSSLFYRKRTKKCDQKNRFSINRQVHEEMNGGVIKDVKPIHYQSTNALRKQFERNQIEDKTIKLNEDEFTNLIKISDSYIQKNSEHDDFVFYQNEGKELIWAFALKQMGEVAKNSDEWHIDATYKLLKNGRGLWIISTNEKISKKSFSVTIFLNPQ